MHRLHLDWAAMKPGVMLVLRLANSETYFTSLRLNEVLRN